MLRSEVSVVGVCLANMLKKVIMDFFSESTSYSKKRHFQSVDASDGPSSIEKKTKHTNTCDHQVSRFEVFDFEESENALESCDAGESEDDRIASDNTAKDLSVKADVPLCPTESLCINCVNYLAEFPSDEPHQGKLRLFN